MSVVEERPSGNDVHHLTLTHDEALILFDLFQRMEAEKTLRFEHPAEWIALGRLTAQLESIPWEVQSRDYDRLLQAARSRAAEGFEGYVEGLGEVKVAADGSVSPVTAGDGPG